MKKIAISFILCLSLLGNVKASVYYISNAGNAENNGLSKETPFSTINSAAEKIQQGDVILLRRGDVFRESVIISEKDIEINAYGKIDEPLPIISGAIEIIDFKPYKDGIYMAKVEDAPAYLFTNNNLMTIARYPNEGWLRTKYWEDNRIPDGATTEQLAKANTMVECPELTNYENNSENFWVGANIKWRHHSWWFETREIVEYNSTGKLFLNDKSFGIQNPREGIKKGWGFYLDNKLELLDTPGEWYFDKENKLIYLLPRDGNNPNEMLVEGSARSKGLIIKDGVVKHVRFQHQQDIGLQINGTSVVQYCEFENIGRDAKVSENGAGGAALHAGSEVRNARISHNSFRNNLNNAISWWQNPSDTTSSIIERNIFKNTGIVDGYGGSGAWHAVAILIGRGNHVHVQYNLIEKSGYVGILFGSAGNFAEYNIIKNAMFTLNDGGGIYTNCSRSTIRYNIIIDTKGGMESSGSWATIAHGIWPEFLHEYRESIIEYNTVIGSGGDGIFLANNFDCVVRNNVCYNNERFQLLIIGSDGRKQNNVNQSHLISRNILFAAKPTQNTLYFDDRNNYGIFKDNYFCKPNSDILIHEGKSWPGMGPHKNFSIKEWQEQFEWADNSPKTDVMKISNKEKDNSEIFINKTEETKIVKLKGIWQNLDGELVSGSVLLEPYGSKILKKTDKQ